MPKYTIRVWDRQRERSWNKVFESPEHGEAILERIQTSFNTVAHQKPQSDTQNNCFDIIICDCQTGQIAHILKGFKVSPRQILVLIYSGGAI